MKLRHLLMVASAAILAACATSTPYQPASKPGGFDGFSQTMIENDRENYLLYRSAEIAVERGFDYFTLAERDLEQKTRLQASPGLAGGLYDPYFGYSFFRPRYGWSRGYAFSHFNGFYGPRRGFAGRRGFGHRGFGYGSAFGYDPFFDDFDVREIKSAIRLKPNPTIFLLATHSQ